MKESDRVKRVAAVLKTRFPKLTFEETINIVYQILEALEED